VRIINILFNKCLTAKFIFVGVFWPSVTVIHLSTASCTFRNLNNTRLTFSWFLVNDQRDAQFFSMCLFLFLTLYMFRAHRAHHQERQIVSIKPLVAVTLCRWPCRVTQFVSPDDEHDVLETCRDLKVKINT